MMSPMLSCTVLPNEHITIMKKLRTIKVNRLNQVTVCLSLLKKQISEFSSIDPS